MHRRGVSRRRKPSIGCCGDGGERKSEIREERSGWVETDAKLRWLMGKVARKIIAK